MNESWEALLQGLSFLRALPWLSLALVAFPLVLLAKWGRIYPHTIFLVLMLVPVLLTFALLIEPQMLLVVAAIDGLIGLVAVVDLLTLPKSNSFSAQRQVMRVASLGMPHEVTLVVSNHSVREASLWICDDRPDEFDVQPLQFVARLSGRSRATLRYELRAKRRGAFVLEYVHLRVRSRFGIWQKFIRCPCDSTVHVYPDMKQLGEYAVLARTNRLSLMGVRRTRRIGQDNEFERLRDYTLDDNHKFIDWRSTARRNRLTVKDFQANQSQRIVFLLDCGRMMTNQAAGLSLLDHGLNATLMLSYVALRQGDSIGLICFSDQVHAYVPPRSGMSQMNRLLHASFDRFPKLVESRYDEAFFYLSAHCRKRSLVVLITNIIDEVNAFQVEQHLSTLVGRHLPLGVLLRDRRTFDAAEQPLVDDTALYQAAAASEILSWRHEVLTDLHHKGVLSLDVFPEDMTAPLVNQYLEIKARHLL